MVYRPLINKLQLVQNAAARLICSTPRFSHVTPVLFSLHWLPVKFRIDFKILIITFKAIHGQAPDYICNLINVRNFSTYGLRSNSELLLVSPSTKTKKTLGDRTFTAAAPSLWNKLPSAIRDEDNFKRFKSKLKTFLFRVCSSNNVFVPRPRTEAAKRAFSYRGAVMWNGLGNNLKMRQI